MNDISLGKYYFTDSFYHKLDPRTKFISTLIFLIMIFFLDSLAAYIAAIIYLIIMKIISKIPLYVIFTSIKPIIILIVFTFIFQALTVSGTDIYKLGPISISIEGIKLAFYKCLSILILVTSASFLTFATTPTEITDGLEKMMFFLNRWKIPVHDFTFMILLAIKFIPILIEQIDRLMKAQISRGVCLDEGNILIRIKNLIPVFIPLFISTFYRATELGLSMEVRGYRGGAHRTSMNSLEYSKNDIVFYIMFSTFIALLLILNYI